jgi:hypothetical protein
MPPAERAALRREPGGWTAADVPLLDEAAELLGQDERAGRVRSVCEQARRVACAQGVLTSPSAPVISAARCSASPICWTSGNWTAAVRPRTTRPWPSGAAADRTWTFGHVIVDEAQEL